MLKLLLICSVILISFGSIYADSLWNQSQHSIYRRTKSPQVGDIVTIKIMNKSAATQEAGTNTSKRSNIGLDYYMMGDNYSSTEGTSLDRNRNNYRFGGRDSYSGLGRTSRKSKVESKVSAIIVQIMENGNLYVVGEHSVNVNDETEIIQISGVVRQEDIGPDNTILSYQIANAKISVKGVGVVGSKQTPGVLSKMFGWMF